MPHNEKRLVYTMVFEQIQSIPYGQVMTYGWLAERVPGCTARMVGYALGRLSGPKDLPWHRVVNAQGRISGRGDGYSDELQRVLLEKEGVIFVDGRIDLGVFRAGKDQEADRE